MADGVSSCKICQTGVTDFSLISNSECLNCHTERRRKIAYNFCGGDLKNPCDSNRRIKMKKEKDNRKI